MLTITNIIAVIIIVAPVSILGLGLVLAYNAFIGMKISEKKIFEELQKKLNLSDDEREHIERINRCSDNVEIENSGDVQILRSQRVKVINSPNAKIEDSDDVEIKDSEKAEVKKSPGAKIEKSIEAKAENSPGAEIVKSQGAKATNSAGIKINNSHGAIVDQTREQTTNQDGQDTGSSTIGLETPRHATSQGEEISPREEKFGKRTYRHYKVSKDFLLKVYEQNDGRLEFVDRYQLKRRDLGAKVTSIAGIVGVGTKLVDMIFLKNFILSFLQSLNITLEIASGAVILLILAIAMGLLIWRLGDNEFYDKIIKEILEENSRGGNTE